MAATPDGQLAFTVDAPPPPPRKARSLKAAEPLSFYDELFVGAPPPVDGHAKAAAIRQKAAKGRKPTPPREDTEDDAEGEASSVGTPRRVRRGSTADSGRRRGARKRPPAADD